MITSFFIFQLIAFIVYEFLIFKRVSFETKNSKILLKVLLTIIISWVASFNFEFFITAILIGLSFGVLDYFAKIIAKIDKVKRYLFLGFFFLKIIVIYFLCFDYDQIFMSIESEYMVADKKLPLIILSFLFCTKPANIIIKELFLISKIKTIVATTEELENAGKLIGTLERFLVLTFMILNQFEAIGFLIASKSILRYHDSNTIKTEYVLIGTMASFAVAIFFGIWIYNA
jgi:phosphate/sulfate permease